MKSDKQVSGVGNADRMLEVLSSVVVGDAGREDVISLLRDEGVNSLDITTRLLTGGGTVNATRSTGESGARGPKEVPSSQRGAPIEHRVPQVPFLLNGTLYDPQDVQRFNGRPLHFVPSAGRDYMLAVDDADIMVN